MVTITTKNFEKASKKEKQESSKKRFFSNAIEKEEQKKAPLTGKAEVVAAGAEESKLYSRRLLKAK